jgi:hypothetical protein
MRVTGEALEACLDRDPAEREAEARAAVSEPYKPWSEMSAAEREEFEDFCDSMSGWGEGP